MRVTEVGVTVSKMISDRNYGNERTEVHLVAELDEPDDPEVTMRQLLGMARVEMLEDLRSSYNAGIRSDALPPKIPAAAMGDPHEPF